MAVASPDQSVARQVEQKPLPAWVPQAGLIVLFFVTSAVLNEATDGDGLPGVEEAKKGLEDEMQYGEREVATDEEKREWLEDELDNTINQDLDYQLDELEQAKARGDDEEVRKLHEKIDKSKARIRAIKEIQMELDNPVVRFTKQALWLNRF